MPFIPCGKIILFEAVEQHMNLTLRLILLLQNLNTAMVMNICINFCYK